MQIQAALFTFRRFYGIIKVIIKLIDKLEFHEWRYYYEKNNLRSGYFNVLFDAFS